MQALHKEIRVNRYLKNRIVKYDDCAFVIEICLICEAYNKGTTKACLQFNRLLKLMQNVFKMHNDYLLSAT